MNVPCLKAPRKGIDQADALQLELEDNPALALTPFRRARHPDGAAPASGASPPSPLPERHLELTNRSVGTTLKENMCPNRIA